jgi:hypothetical protein
MIDAPELKDGIIFAHKRRPDRNNILEEVNFVLFEPKRAFQASVATGTLGRIKGPRNVWWQRTLARHPKSILMGALKRN